MIANCLKDQAKNEKLKLPTKVKGNKIVSHEKKVFQCSKSINKVK